jgi:hypothetical protein
MQPYFLPYIGYWQLVKTVDNYIVYDDVTYIKGGWINRNNFLINGQKKMYTIGLKDAGSYKLIKDIEIGDDFIKFLKMIMINYSKAPFYNEVFPLVKKMIDYEKKSLSAFILNSIHIVADYLDIKTNILISSELNKNNELKGKDKVIDICKLMNASEYYNAIGGKELYDKGLFLANGINLSFLKSNLTSYKQFGNDFIPGLSILDVLMFNSPLVVNKMLDDFSLE